MQSDLLVEVGALTARLGFFMDRFTMEIDHNALTSLVTSRSESPQGV